MNEEPTTYLISLICLTSSSRPGQDCQAPMPTIDQHRLDDRHLVRQGLVATLRHHYASSFTSQPESANRGHQNRQVQAGEWTRAFQRLSLGQGPMLTNSSIIRALESLEISATIASATAPQVPLALPPSEPDASPKSTSLLVL